MEFADCHARLLGPFGLSPLLAILVLFLALTAAAQNGRENVAERYFTNVELVDQNGKTHRLYLDLIKDKVVVINSFFASSFGPDLVVNRNLEKIQDSFSEFLGKELLIISITVDPETDTPEQLNRYAKKHNVVNGRLFLTGSKTNVDFALGKLGMYVKDNENLSNTIVIGNSAKGFWKKAFALAKPEDLIEIVRSVMDDKGN